MLNKSKEVSGAMEEFENYNIKKNLVSKWLQVIYNISESEDLENAISLAKMLSSTDEEHEIANAISILYRSECSGDINPPIKMRELYDEICKNNV